MRDLNDDDIPQDMKDLCLTLLKTEQAVPQDSLFRDDLSEELVGRFKTGTRP